MVRGGLQADGQGGIGAIPGFVAQLDAAQPRFNGGGQRWPVGQDAVEAVGRWVKGQEARVASAWVGGIGGPQQAPGQLAAQAEPGQGCAAQRRAGQCPALGDDRASARTCRPGVHQRVVHHHATEHAGVGWPMPAGQGGGDGAGQGAAGAVVMRGGDARGAQPALGLGALQPVQAESALELGALCVTTGDEHAAWPQGLQCLGKVGDGVQVADVARCCTRRCQQRQRFRAVGGDHGGAGQQPLAVSLDDGAVGESSATRAGAQHRIDHQGEVLVRIDALGGIGAQAVHPACHGFDRGHAAQQAGLDGAGAQVRVQGLQLGFELLRVHREDGVDPLRVLCGQAGGNGAQVHAQGVGGALVGAQACTSCGVQPRDGPDDGGGPCGVGSGVRHHSSTKG